MKPPSLLPWLLAVGVTGAMCVDVSRTGVSGPAQLEAAGTKGWPSEDAEIVHVLNRIGYGPRPGDIERVRAMGIARYIDEQLHPERIADAAMASHLSGLTTLTMSNREIATRFAAPLMEARAARRRDAATAPPDQATAAGSGQAAADAAEQRTPEERRIQQQAQLPLLELSQQKLLRAVYSERQLEEVLTDFWFNHFNVDARKGQSRFLLTEYEREAIRPHVLGRFRDLLGATATSPAMLFYLDNWMSADPEGPHFDGGRRAGGVGRRRPGLPGQRPAPARQGLAPAQGQGRNMRRGLNENYGRELMELHTLGVDGGYTQKDVTEVARAFTGWTIENPRNGGGFRFVPQLHDDRKKVVLGHTIDAGGQQDGERVLDILARHPSTARFIAKALAARFVSDEPPAALIDRLAATFTRTDGDLRAVMTALLTSREFRSPDSDRAKVKTPFEFVASALRASGADVDDARPALRWVQQLGMPLYQCQPPTGYKDTVETWVNTGALVNRMNVALELASGSARGIRVRPIDHAETLIAGGLSPTTRDTIARATAPAQAAALALGSPEFQRR